MKEPLLINLDSEFIILRQLGEDDAEPAILSGQVVLDLSERHDIRDLSLAFSGRARITYTDLSGSYKTHNFEQPVYFHDQSFLPSFEDIPQTSSLRFGAHAASQGAPQRQGSSSALSALGEPQATAGSSNSSTQTLHDSAHPHIDHHGHSRTHGHGHHSHTFNQGLHSFPFSFTIPGSLPASLRVNIASSIINYQLKATATKASVFGGKWTAKRTVHVIRGLSPEAAEFNQTLEIDNTWPGKIMYNLTIPHKAFCAGESVPVALKFTPIGKGVRVTQLVTSVKENLTVMTKHHQPHSTSRDVITKKHNFVSRSSLVQTSSNNTQGSTHPVSLPPSRSGSSSDLVNMANQRLNLEDHPITASSDTSSGARGRTGPSTSTDSTSPSSGTPSASHNHPSATSTSGLLGTSGTTYPIGAPTVNVLSGPSSTNASRHGSRASSPERIYYGRSTLDPDFGGAVDEDGTEDVDVDAVIQIPLPVTMAPSHPVEPLHITHKLKWSAFIRNLDGHTSELRCALPIHVLSPLLSVEAGLASSGTRSLLFGPSGILVPAAEGIQQVDLPSYGEHILDRVANIDSASSGGALAGSGHNGSRTAASFVRSPWATPITSPPRSPGLHGESQSRSNSFFPDHTNRSINWADSELLNTLSMSLPQQQQQPTSSQHSSSQSSSHNVSPSTSRPTSRPGSRPSSRPTSRASSPIRGESTNGQSNEVGGSVQRKQASLSQTGLAQHPHDPQPHRTSSGFFNTYLPKPLKPFTSMGPGSFHSISHDSIQERTQSTGGLSSLFHHHGHKAGPIRQASSSSHDDHSLSLHSPPHSRSSFLTGSSGHHTDVAQGLSAALEAHQQRQTTRRSHGKGKKKGGIFSSMQADDEDDEDTHRASEGHSVEHSPHMEMEEPVDTTGNRYLSQVPSYEVARRGFLGGGVPPLSLSVGLPCYDEVPTLIQPERLHPEGSRESH